MTCIVMKHIPFPKQLLVEDEDEAGFLRAALITLVDHGGLPEDSSRKCNEVYKRVVRLIEEKEIVGEFDKGVLVKGETNDHGK